MKDIYVTPAAGLTVPLPNGETLPIEGLSVPHDRFIRRRIADGDVIVGKPPKAATTPDTQPDKSGAGTKR